MYIKGTPDYNKDGEKRETGLFIGPVTQDGELRTTGNGKRYGCVSVRAFNRPDGTAAFMTLKSFSTSMAALLAELRKGDRILAAGVVETREYNGKQYTDMLLDFLTTEPDAAFSGGMAAAPSYAAPAGQSNSGFAVSRCGAPSTSVTSEKPFTGSSFAEIGEEDGELPF